MNPPSLDPLFKEIAIHELWKRGDLTYKLHAGQGVINDSFRKVGNTLFVCNCSRRFGKTYWLATKCLEKAITKPQAIVIVATAFLTDLEQFIVPTFRLVMDDMPEHQVPTWNESKKKFKFKNGSEIRLVGLDRKPDGGRGNYCDLYAFEEAGFISNLEYLYSSVVVPMTANREGAKIIMISTPSKTPAHPFKNFCDKATAEEAYVKLTIHDNPMMSEEEIDRLRSECLSESDWRREYLCDFAVDTNLAIIPEFAEASVKPTSRDEYFPYYHRYVAMDLGFRDFTAVLFGYWDFKRSTLVIEDEHVIKGQYTTDILSASIKAKEKDLWGGTNPRLRIADNNNLLLLQDLTTLHSLSFAPTNKDQLEAMVNEVRLLAKGGKIEVDPRCTQLVGCLKYGVWTENRKQFDRSPTYGHFDALAALIYLVRNLDRHTNPIPRLHGHKSFDDLYIPREESSSQAEAALRKIFQVKPGS